MVKNWFTDDKPPYFYFFRPTIIPDHINKCNQMSCEYVTHTPLFSNNQSITSILERIQTCCSNLVVEDNTLLYDVPIALTQMVI